MMAISIKKRGAKKGYQAYAIYRLTIIFLSIGTTVFAQQADTVRIFKADGWIEQMTNSLGVKLAVTNNVEKFSVDTNGEDYAISPNTSLVSKLSVNYRIFSFSFNYTPRFLPSNNDDKIRGKTRNFGIGFGFNIHKLFTELNYSRTKGYYLENTKDLNPLWKPGDPYYQFPNLVTTNFEGLTGYSFNPRFSQIALTSQTERQMKSAGSFIPTFSYRYYIIDDQSPTGNTQKTNNFKIGIGAGYHYTLVIKNQFYASLGVTPSVGHIFTRLLTREGTDRSITRSNNIFVQAEGKAGIGYNGRTFFTGAFITASYLSNKQEGTTATYTDDRIFYQVFVGYRFKAPKFLRKTYEKIYGIMPK